MQLNIDSSPKKKKKVPKTPTESESPPKKKKKVVAKASTNGTEAPHVNGIAEKANGTEKKANGTEKKANGVEKKANGVEKKVNGAEKKTEKALVVKAAAGQEALIANFRVCKETQDILEKRGIKTFFPIQAQTFDSIYDGHDLVGRGERRWFAHPFQRGLVLERPWPLLAQSLRSSRCFQPTLRRGGCHESW